mgnify:CR=1 FL=1
MKARVDRADETDAEGAKPLLAGLAQVFLRMALVWVDGGYKRRFAAWVAAELGWRAEPVQHPDAGLRWGWVRPGQEPPPARPRLVRPQPALEQGLRGAAGQRRGVDRCRFGPPPAPPAGPLTPFPHRPLMVRRIGQRVVGKMAIEGLEQERIDW